MRTRCALGDRVIGIVGEDMWSKLLAYALGLAGWALVAMNYSASSLLPNYAGF